MATNTQYLPFGTYSLAEFKLWGQATGIALSAFGWSLDSNTPGQVNWSTIKYTPAQDSVGLGTPGTLNFRGAYDPNGIAYSGTVDVVTYDGATWQAVTTFTSSTSTPYPGTDITNGTRWRLYCYEVWVSAVNPKVYIRFEYIGNAAVTANAQIRITVGTSSGDTPLSLTSVAAASGGNTVYTGVITGGGSNAFQDKSYTVTGFTNSANNGTFTCTASTTTTLTLNNASGVAETPTIPGFAQSYSSNIGLGTGQIATAPINLVPSNIGASNNMLGNNYPCYFSGDNGNRFAMSMWSDQGSASGIFCFERSLTNAGAYYTSATGIGIVQTVNDAYRANTTGPITKSFPLPNTAGNLILAFASNVGTSTSGITISDTQSNTYHPLFAAADLTVNADAQIGWYAEGIAAGANTVTVSWTTGTTPPALALMEYTGLKASGSLDQNPAANTGNSGSWSTSAATTTQNEELLIAMVVSASGSTVATAPFVSRANTNNPTVFGIIADERVDVTGSYTGTGTNTSSKWVAQLATFKATVNSNPITPYWSMFWMGFSNTFVSQAIINTSGSSWIKTNQDGVPWVLGPFGDHTQIIESATSNTGTMSAYMNTPPLPFFPLVGWVGNPCTTVLGLKLADIPRDGEFTVQMYGTTHTYMGNKSGGMVTFGGSSNNYWAIRFD